VATPTPRAQKETNTTKVDCEEKYIFINLPHRSLCDISLGYFSYSYTFFNPKRGAVFAVPYGVPPPPPFAARLSVFGPLEPFWCRIVSFGVVLLRVAFLSFFRDARLPFRRRRLGGAGAVGRAGLGRSAAPSVAARWGCDTPRHAVLRNSTFRWYLGERSGFRPTPS
jgi:hypothetical protein